MDAHSPIIQNSQTENNPYSWANRIYTHQTVFNQKEKSNHMNFKNILLSERIKVHKGLKLHDCAHDTTE